MDWFHHTDHVIQVSIMTLVIILLVFSFFGSMRGMDWVFQKLHRKYMQKWFEKEYKDGVPYHMVLWLKANKIWLSFDNVTVEPAPSVLLFEEYKIGTVFRVQQPRKNGDDVEYKTYVCTDVGSRVIVGMRIYPDRVHVYEGPPYSVPEEVFDENDLASCERMPL